MKAKFSINQNPIKAKYSMPSNGLSASFSIGGGGVSSDYLLLFNKPLINGVELVGDKNSLELGLASSEQGLLADSALQPNDNISELVNNVGYITGITSSDIQTALGYIPYSAENPSGFITVSALNGYATENWVGQQGYLTSSDLSGYATETWVGQQGYITGITSSDVTTALGYTPYDNSNPAGYITSASLPTVNNSTITIQKNGSDIESFNLNQPTNETINITVPTQTSDLTNNSGFITNTVNNLTNYYLKSDTYTKTEVQDLISGITGITIEVVSVLPASGENGVIYLVPKDGEAPDVYNEYVWVSDTNTFELIGSTAVDLDGYATEDWVINQGYITLSALNGYATETFVNNGLATKQNTLTAGNNIQIQNNVISATDTTYTAGTGISIENGVISNTQTSAEWGNIEGDIADQTDLIELLDGKQDLLTSDNAGTDIEIVNGAGGDDTVSGNTSILLEKAVADGLNSVTVSGSLKRSLLPEGYTQYDYITVNGDCYFITDYYPSNITEVKTKTFVHKQPTSPLVTRWTGSPTNDTFGFYMGNVSGRLTVFYGRYSDSKYLNIENVKLNIEHDIYMGVNSITFDGTSYSITRDTFTSTQPIYIGAFNQTGSTLAGMMYGRIYPVQFIEGGKTVKHYIPCKNDNGVIGLYEAITGTFISSTGSGTAKKGRPTINLDTIPDTYTRIEFLQADGTQYIDSGVIANFANNKIEQTATVQYTTSNTSRELMGTNGYGFWGKNASNKIEAVLGQVTVTDNALVKNTISWTTNPDGNTLVLNVNSNQYTSTASSFVDANYAYYVFALGIRVGSGASASFLCHAKVYNYMIAIDNEVVCYLIPVKRVSDDVLGMYDVVTGTFKTNAGTGTFTAGSNIALPSPTNPLPIVSNNGQLKASANLFDQSLFNTDVGITVTYYTFSIDNGTYTMSTNIPYARGSLANVFLFAGQVSSGASSRTNGVTTNTPRTITVTNGKYTVAYRSRVPAGDTAYNPKDYNWMLARSSSAQNYQPYVEGGLYVEGLTETITDSANNSATTEMLLSMGDYTDTQEILNGDVTRKVGVIVLDGTEEWGYNTSGAFYCDDFTDILLPNECICTHFVGVSSTFNIASMPNNSIKTDSITITRLYVKTSDYADVATFKTWLASQYNAGTPVIIVYPLATETTETVTGQTLTTVQGDSTLTISQASIDNLPIEANYNVQGGTVINFVNDSGFITNTVNNLTNYYLKSETYTKLEVQQLIASIPQFSVEVVQSLPVTGERMVLYLVPKDGESPDVYEEYIWVEDDSQFELIGSTAIDLTDYATKVYVDTGLGLKANDNAVVHLSGNETIDGKKTFNDTTYFKGVIASISSTSDPTSLNFRGGTNGISFSIGAGEVAKLTNQLLNVTTPINATTPSQSETENKRVTTIGYINSKLADYVETSDLSTVATTGDFNDLINQPTIGNGTITFTQGGVTKGTITTNQSGDTTIDFDAGGGGAVDSVNGQTGTVVLTASDVGAVDLTSAQDISGKKTFLGEKAIYFKQQATTNKLGFTLYNPSNTELGALEYRPSTIGANALLNINTSYSNACYVGFRYWGTAVNIIAPKVATAGDYYIPTHITNGNTTVSASNTGTVNISSLLPDISTKQDTLVSGTNIKTINNTSLLGSGNIDIQGGVSMTYDSTTETLTFA